MNYMPFSEDQYTFLIIIRSVFLRMKNFQTEVVEKIKTHILCSVTSTTPLPPENRAFYEIIIVQ